MSYIRDIYSHSILVGEEYSEESWSYKSTLPMAYPKKEQNILETYKIQNEEQKEYVKNFVIYEMNMDKVMEFWYSKDKEKIEEYKYFIMLDLNLKELEILSKRDKMVERYMEEIDKLNQNPVFWEYMSAEEDERKIHNTEMRRAKEEGIAEGLIEGEEQAKLEMAKNFLKLGIDSQTISSGTGLTIEEIEKLKEI